MAFQIDIKDNATTQDTVNAIIEVINKTSKEGFVPELAKAFNPNGSKLEYIKRLFDFICNKVDYEMDPPGWEKIYTPAKLFLTAKGDCKKMTTAIGAVLKAAGIEPLLKVITYDGASWAHIYIIAKINEKYYILDPVNNKRFDSEINHKLAAVYNLAGNFKIMPGNKLSILGSRNNNSLFNSFNDGINDLSGDLDSASSSVGSMFGMSETSLSGPEIEDILAHFETTLSPGLSGMGKLKILSKLKNALTKVVKVGVKVSAAPMRASVLGIILLGKALEHSPLKMNLAHNLAKTWQADNGKKLSDLWTKFGGDPKQLKATISKASSTQLAGILPNGDFNISGMGVVTLAAVGAALVAAAPIIASLQKAMKDAKVLKEGSAVDNALSATTAAGVDALNDDGSIPGSVTDTLNASGVTNLEKSGGITDLSFNTLIKSLFLICISPIVPGVSFYLLNFICISVVILYLTKSLKYEIRF